MKIVNYLNDIAHAKSSSITNFTVMLQCSLVFKKLSRRHSHACTLGSQDKQSWMVVVR